VQEHDLAIVPACQIAGLSRTAWYRPSADRSARDAPVIDALLALVAKQTKWGSWLCFTRLRGTGYAWNWKRVYRVYLALRLNLTRRRKKRLYTRPHVALKAPAILNRTWALDFMGDTPYDGRCYRALNVLDEGNLEALAIEIDTSLPCVWVIALLDQSVAIHGAPAMLRCDNGPEFIAAALAAWCVCKYTQIPAVGKQTNSRPRSCGQRQVRFGAVERPEAGLVDHQQRRVEIRIGAPSGPRDGGTEPNTGRRSGRTSTAAGQVQSLVYFSERRGVRRCGASGAPVR
jgi:hypothetical protein